MALTQLSVFLENRPGTLLEVTETLRDANVDIKALSLSESENFGILRLIVDDSYKACDAIKQSGRLVKLNHVIGLKIENKPGGLVRILTLLHNNGFEVEYMYAFLSKTDNSAEVAVRVKENREQAETLLLSSGCEIL